MSEIIHGPETVKQSPGHTFDPVKGHSNTLRWHGLIDKLPQVVTDMGLEGYPWTVEPHAGPVAVLEVDTASSDQANDPEMPIQITWGIDASTIERTLWEHPKVKGPMHAVCEQDVLELGDNTMGEYRKWVADMADGKIHTKQPVMHTLVPETKNLTSRLVAGVDSFIIPKVVVTLSVMLAPQSETWMPFAVIGMVYTKENLLATDPPYTPPASMIAALPDGEYMVMGARHTVDNSGNRTIEYELDWADKWDEWIYPNRAAQPP